MSPPANGKGAAKNRVKLSDFKERKRDEGAIEIEFDDGAVLKIDPPDLWSDSVFQLAAGNDPVGAARELLGTEKYEAFVAAGGSSALLLSIVADQHGISLGELAAFSSS